MGTSFAGKLWSTSFPPSPLMLSKGYQSGNTHTSVGSQHHHHNTWMIRWTMKAKCNFSENICIFYDTAVHQPWFPGCRGTQFGNPCKKNTGLQLSHFKSSDATMLSLVVSFMPFSYCSSVSIALSPMCVFSPYQVQIYSSTSLGKNDCF